MAAVTRMTRDLNQERASLLAREAVELANTGHAEKASRKLREAAALGHDNSEVQAAFLKLHRGQDDTPLLVLCRRYALYHDEKAGEDAATYLRGEGQGLSGSAAVECLKLILDSSQATLSLAQDSIIAELARQSQDVRKYFASELQASPTEFFDNIYARGDGAANCLRNIVLQGPLWPSEAVRLRIEDDLFQLLVAKLMESGHDHDGRALKGIALLMVADKDRLQPLIDEESFDAILSSLDLRLPADVRSHATLAVSKYFEVSEAVGMKFLNDFVKSRVAKQKSEEIVAAFSAAASLFPIVPKATTPLFLTEGFLPSLISMLDRTLKTSAVKDAFLLLLNAACMDGACRSAISKYCSAWLSHMVSNGDGNQPAVAATILAKLRTANSEKPSDQRVNNDTDDIHELVHLFKDTLNQKEGQNAPDSLEGLAYTSLKPEVKEELSRDPAFLKTIFRVLATNAQRPTAVVGGLSVISNLTQYAPFLSEEQQKMSQLKAYANATKTPAPDPLDDEQHVSTRCSAVIDAGVMSVLVQLGKGNSSTARSLIDNIILSLSKTPKNRGKIAQQGAVKLLISHLQSRPANPDKGSSGSYKAANALARVLISVDPSHVFPSSGLPHITSAVAPLVTLLNPASAEGLSDQPRDLLPVFESLLALTNLASSSDGTAGELIVRSAWDAVEDLLLSKNTMIRRASCELVCNLAALGTGAAKFADGSRRSVQRLHVLLALADVDDISTRRAAGGALAMLTEHDAAIGSILEIKKSTEILLGLCQDEEEDIAHRGIVCVKNMACASGDIGPKARDSLKSKEAVRILKDCLTTSRNPAILQLGIEALNSLIDTS